MVRRRLDGWRTGDIAEALRVNEKTVDRWRKTPQETVELILQLRKERRWEPCKIEGYLKNYAEGVTVVGHNAIHRILIKAGLNKPIAKPRKTGVNVDSSGHSVTTCGSQTSR